METRPRRRKLGKSVPVRLRSPAFPENRKGTPERDGSRIVVRRQRRTNYNISINRLQIQY